MSNINSSSPLDISDSSQVQVAPEVGAIAREVGAIAPEVGAIAPEVGAIAPEVGAIAPEVGAIAPEVGAIAREAGAIAPEVWVGASYLCFVVIDIIKLGLGNPGKNGFHCMILG